MRRKVPDEIRDIARDARSVTVLTGAGMSAESGIPTFRDAQTGLWTRVRPEDLATPEAWDRDPARVFAWYAWRAAAARRCEPNPGHRAIAAWEGREGVELTVVTQNVDDLHERAGSRRVAHLHGSLFAYKCDFCEEPYTGRLDLPQSPHERLEPPLCPRCGLGRIRPDIVWFGEPLDEGVLDPAFDAIRDGDLLLVVGSSGKVYPGAGLPGLATRYGVPVIEVNPHGSDLSHELDQAWPVTAAVGLPALIEALEE